MVEVEFRPDHTYATPGGAVLPGITSRLKAAGLLYEFEGNDFADMTKGARIHEALHFDCEGDLDESSLNECDRPYVEAARKARRELGLEIIRAEYPVGNETLGYATKIDLYCRWNGRLTVANWKTGQKVYRCYAIQSALEALIFTPEPVQRLGIHLQEDGDFKPVHYADRNDFTIAKAALSIAAWKKGSIA